MAGLVNLRGRTVVALDLRMFLSPCAGEGGGHFGTLAMVFKGCQVACIDI